MEITNNLFLDFQDFPLKLKMIEKLSLPLCKGKYFKFQLKLMYSPQTEIPRSIRIPLSVKIFTACKPHKEVFKSLTGDEILKGTVRNFLVYNCMMNTHVASFKILINDISSHFSGFDLIIEAEENDYCRKNGIRIKPVIVKGVSVMSKEKVCKKFREVGGLINSE